MEGLLLAAAPLVLALGGLWLMLRALPKPGLLLVLVGLAFLLGLMAAAGAAERVGLLLVFGLVLLALLRGRKGRRR